MSFSIRSALSNLLFSFAIVFFLSSCRAGESYDDAGQDDMIEWRHYGHDPGGQRFSPLDRIDRENVSGLEVAWRYETGEYELLREAGRQDSFSATPLIVEGVIYFSTPSGRVFALEADTGRELWIFDPYAESEERVFGSNRGVSFWESRDGSSVEKRILSTIPDGRVVSLDAESGRPDSAFGERGMVSLPTRISAPPAIFEDLFIVGSIPASYPPTGDPVGDVRAYNVRTGELEWKLHTIPREGEYGVETWEGDSWRDRRKANAWAVMSVDRENGLLFVPTATAAYDFYGGDRPGKNLYGNTLLAVDARSGEIVWYRQLVYHDLWDYDLPSQPAQFSLQRDGREIPAVAQTTKMGFVFIFHRLTGEPLFPIDEREVPPSEIPGEQAWPVQPFPVLPPPLARQTMTEAELNDLTPEIYRECREHFDRATVGEAYTPTGHDYSILFPGSLGGGNWGGASIDPDRNLLLTITSDVGSYTRMIKQPDDSILPYRRGGEYGAFGRFKTRETGIPCQKPPWGRLHAIDLGTGEIAWEVPLGFVELMADKGFTDTGTASLGGGILTAGGLFFVGATNDRRFRAFDTETGRELWQYELTGSSHAIPATWLGQTDGKQYVAVASSGGGLLRDRSPFRTHEIVVWRLAD